jgi:hypothetical protein
MNGRFLRTLSIAAALALGVTGLSQAEVWVELDGSGRVVATHVPSSKNTVRVWRATGEAPTRAQVLNVDGALRGDGRPDIAVDPLTGLPRAVWSMRSGSGFDIVTSTFNGRAWTEPMPLSASVRVDDLDPRLSFRADGVAVVVWWTSTATPAVHMGYLTPAGRWVDQGVVSAPLQRAKRPAVHHLGEQTIIAYWTPGQILIQPVRIVLPVFGDGPTPFPRDDNHSGPGGDDEPPGPPPDAP